MIDYEDCTELSHNLDLEPVRKVSILKDNPLLLELIAPDGYQIGWIRTSILNLNGIRELDRERLFQALSDGWIPVYGTTHPALRDKYDGYVIYEDLILCIRKKTFVVLSEKVDVRNVNKFIEEENIKLEEKYRKLEEYSHK